MSGSWGSRPRVKVTRVVVLALAAAVVLAACSGSGTMAATSPGAAAPGEAPNQDAMPLPAPTVAGTLAFARVTSADDEGYVMRTGDICLVRADGTGLTRLDVGAADEAQPAWSPDGRQIAYTAYRLAGDHRSTVRVMNADGSARRRLLQSALAGEWPAWSRDGTRIAFAQRARYAGGWAGALGLAVVNADGSGLRELTLTSDPRVGDRSAAWAPDGRIYFLRVRIGDVLWIDPAGSGPTRVTTGGGYTAFALSPDGKQLAVFDREHDHLVLLPASGRGTAVVLVDDMSRYVPSLSVRMAWSPDGTAIAFAASSDRARTPYPPGSALYIVNADGSGLSVVPNTGKVWDPAWRPE